ncbi:hypothetical protein DV532_28310 (plasmid) [Pseudomonas sp. Leaf58]|uniref:hypothetical protein n=1 Tax=unclassified Pseudomonas TaxID=196821 RepID=UPI0006FB5019|nr:hypothetical protein [Pseudomonas sp. Leaf58]AYG48174.1 hypothetical protein DV532_28310 [Pseudomonas sp. Leaf58]KQN62276.1 hypothetical protein ASF02_08925 [Pseudomonas sp. Leaf58]
MKRLALMLPALLLSSVALAAKPVTYDVKIVEDGHLVYSFTTSAPMGKGVHLASAQIDRQDQDMALDYLNDQVSIELTGNLVDAKGILTSNLLLVDQEKFIDAKLDKQPPLVNMPNVATSRLNTPLKLTNGQPMGVSYSLGTTGAQDGSKPAKEPRTLLITATWAH